MTIEIIHGDALEEIPKLGKFDYVITDPPYTINHTAMVTSESSVMSAIKMAQGMQQSFISHVLKSILKSDKFAAWVFCDWRQVSFLMPVLECMGLRSPSCIVWDKVNPSFSRYYHHRHEVITFGSNFYLSKGKYLGTDIVRVKKITSSQKEHPFDKPPELVEEICKQFPKGRVLDPFCGAGGLLIGAASLGWDVVGIDIVEEFSDIARSRLMSEYQCKLPV